MELSTKPLPHGLWTFWFFKKVLGQSDLERWPIAHGDDLKRYKAGLGMPTSTDKLSLETWHRFTQKEKMADGHSRFWITHVQRFHNDRIREQDGAWLLRVSHVEKGAANEGLLMKMMGLTPVHDLDRPKDVNEKFSIRVAREADWAGSNAY